MSTTTPDQALEPAAAATAPPLRTRTFYWSLRRELWENRSIYLAPLITAGVVLLGLLIGVVNVPRHVVVEGTMAIDSSQRAMAVQIPFDAAAAVILVAAMVTGFFYCLGALYGERRDRTILFWKSLPVSDLTTVAAKATVPMVVLPIATYLVIIATHLVLLAASVPIMAANGFPAFLFWQELPLLRTWGVLALVLACLSLWYAPIWGWAFVISGWAKRVTFLWAVGPPLGLVVFEALAFHTHHVNDILHDRIAGGLDHLFATKLDVRGRVTANLDQLDVGRFFSTPGLWIGLIVAAAFFAIVVWQRRYRAPF